ncbi:MAG: oligosaccharide flippase family protein, partial [Bacteroidales bacterium]|nr:oligosaccharide flippase family protein [Bacteroidales bacterium]
MESLKSRTIKGVGWGTLQSLLNYGVGFVVGIVLARLLGPGDYGLIGMAVIFINLSQAIIDSGLSSSLIRKKDASDEDFQTVFLVNMGISVLMYGFLFLIAPVIATFFKEPRLVAVLRVLTVVLFFNALSMVQRTK